MRIEFEIPVQLLRSSTSFAIFFGIRESDHNLRLLNNEKWNHFQNQGIYIAPYRVLKITFYLAIDALSSSIMFPKVLHV